MWRILLKVLRLKVTAWKPSKQANTLISFSLPRPGSARFVLHGRIRSYTKGDLRDLLNGPLPAFLRQQCMVWDYRRDLPVRVYAFCDTHAVFQMGAGMRH